MDDFGHTATKEVNQDEEPPVSADGKQNFYQSTDDDRDFRST